MSQTLKWQLENKLLKALRDAGLSLIKKAVDTSVQQYKQQRYRKRRFKHGAHTAKFASATPTSTPPRTLKHIDELAHSYVNLYQSHTLHFALKAISFLPDAVIERINWQIDAPKAQDYPTADAFLRLIIGFNRKIRQPLTTAHMEAFRQRFSAYVVSLQSPIVWQHEHPLAALGLAQFLSLSKPQAVTWGDRIIQNADGGDMRLRCYQPATSQQTFNPIILYFHGGGFCIGDLDTHHEFCYHLCAKSGWQVVSVDYRLAPEFPAPVALKDCLAAYAWLSQHAKDFGVFNDHIIVAGDSAGGCLAALVAQQLSQSKSFETRDKSAQEQSLQDEDINTQIFRQVAGLAPPIAQLTLYPVTDTKTDYPSWDLYSKGLLLNYEDILVFDSAYIQKSNLQRNDALISPMAGNNSKLCPSFIVAAEFDMLRDEAIAYAEQLKEFGINTQLLVVKGAPHGFVHLASVHGGLHVQTCAAIDDFIDFVYDLPNVDFKNEPMI